MAELLVRQRWWLAGAASAVLLALLPLYAGGYTISLFIVLFANIALATAWSFFSGATGYVSLATAAFLGLGVYITAISHVHTSIPFVLLAAIAAGFVVALLVGLSTLRLRGIYFLIFSFGLTELMHQVFAWWEITQNHTMSRYISINVSSTVVFEILLAVALLTVLGSWYVGRTRLGYALRCIGADETVARHTGIDTTRVKVLVFAVSASVMTLVGAVLALRYRYVDPAVAFNNAWSFQVLIAALLGGPSRPWGPAVGAVPLILLSDHLAGTFPHHFGIALGLCFVVIVYFLSGGLAPLIERWYHSWRRRGQIAPSLDRMTAAMERYFPAGQWRRMLTSPPGLMAPVVEQGRRRWKRIRALAAPLLARLAQLLERCQWSLDGSPDRLTSLPSRMAPLVEQCHRGWNRGRELASSLPGRMAPLLEQCHRGWDQSRKVLSSLLGRMAPFVEQLGEQCRRCWHLGRVFVGSLPSRIAPLAARYRRRIRSRLRPVVTGEAPGDAKLGTRRERGDETHRR